MPFRHACAFLLLLGGLILASLAFAPAASPAKRPHRPNIIVIQTDDQSVNETTPDTMPRTTRLLAGPGGTSFTNSFVSSPLCCPSRAGLLTGQYPHNNGVLDNTPGYGALRDKDQTLFTWLHDAGYHTAHVGRFLLNYDTFSTTPATPGTEPPSAPPAPPGVDDWFGYAAGPTHYYSAPFSDNGTPRITAPRPPGYVTRVIENQAREFVAAAAPSRKPFFLWLGHLAPHVSQDDATTNCGPDTALPEADALRPYRRQPLPRWPSFNEAEIDDKPNWVSFRSPLEQADIHYITRAWRCALASLTTVDEGVARIVRELRELGELGRTAIFFTSDNGLLFGEHRIVVEKIYPYDEALRVPLFARIPARYLGGRRPPREISKPVANIDLTATILDLANSRPCNADGRCRTLDGRSLLPLLGARGPRWPARRGVLAQVGNRACGTVPAPGTGLPNQYDAIRTRTHLYVEHNRVDPTTGACDRPEFELYDLRADPYQLDNIAVDPATGTPPGIQSVLARRLHALARCAGVAGRDAPQPDGAGGNLPRCE